MELFFQKWDSTQSLRTNAPANNTRALQLMIAYQNQFLNLGKEMSFINTLQF